MILYYPTYFGEQIRDVLGIVSKIRCLKEASIDERARNALVPIERKYMRTLDNGKFLILWLGELLNDLNSPLQNELAYLIGPRVKRRLNERFYVIKLITIQR